MLPVDPVALRRCAEERLRAQHPEAGQVPGRADAQRLVHELQVHQIELEMQNEELQKARDEMEAGLDKYSELYDFAPVGYLTLDREGMICEANLTSATLLGIERARLVKRRFGLCVSPADRPAFTAFLTKVFASQAKEFCEVTLLKDGQLPVEVRIEATHSAAGQECRAVLEDITEHKRTEADRLILNKLESTGTLAGGLAHDFNNLLTVILLDLELAQALDHANVELAQLLKEAKKAAVKASGLTRLLITFARGGGPICKLARLSDVIQETVPLALSGSNVRSEISQADDLWLAEMDVGQIGQVIRNMVLNAREAMPQGGTVFIRAENAVLDSHDQPSLPAGEYVRVSIADQGCGVTKDVLPKIFDPYFSTKENGSQKGMGLGLSICHSVIRQHGGAITVNSEVGVGTTLHIYLPATRKPGREAVKAAVPTGVPRPGRVLVMEDEERLRKVVGQTLLGMGHEAELAEDGQKAVELYKNAMSLGRHFDAVILDLTVRDGMGGPETLQELRKLDPDVKAVLMSGYTNDPAILEPERFGFKDVVAKPFDGGKLQAVLSRVMDSGSTP